MSEKVRTKIRSYAERPDRTPGFFLSMFRRAPEYDTNTEEIEYDIKRTNRRVMTAVQDLDQGTPALSHRQFTSKIVVPPVVGAHSPIPTSQLMFRDFGETIYDAAKNSNWVARMAVQIAREFSAMIDMAIRTIEWHASQVMQTWQLKLVDTKNNRVYEIDFLPKASHNFTAPLPWSDPAANIIEDLEDGMDAVRTDHKRDPGMAVMGRNSFQNFINNADVLKKFEKDKLNVAALAPSMRDDGSKYQGYIDIGAYRLEVFTYQDYYEPYDGSATIDMMDPDKVIIKPVNELMDLRLVFGGIPEVMPSADPFRNLIPGTMRPANMPMRARIFKDEKGEAYNPEIKYRDLPLPVSVDAWTVITTA